MNPRKNALLDELCINTLRMLSIDAVQKASPLGEEEVKLTKQNLGWPEKPNFYVPAKAEKHFRNAIPKGHKVEKNWNTLLAAYKRKFPKLAKELQQLIKNELKNGWQKNIPCFPANEKGLAPGQIAMEKYDFSVENVCKRALVLLKNQKEAKRYLDEK